MSDSWHVVGACVAGLSHIRSGQPCQDACLREILPDGTLLIAVADGAGSRPLADVGAALAVQTALAETRRLLTEQPLAAIDWSALLQTAFAAARTAIEAEAARRNSPAVDLAATLLLAVATTELIAVGQVGDGAVVVRTGDDIAAVTAPAHGEYINETTFLTSPDALEKAQWVVRSERIDALAVFSDGLQMLALKMPQGTAHVPFFRPLFSFAARSLEPLEAEHQLRAFLQSPRITARADDDLTLVLAVRRATVRANYLQHQA